MSELTTPDAVREQIAALGAPLREQLQNVEAAYTAKQAELVELRETREQLRRALRALDPSFVVPVKSKAKSNGGAKKQVAEETLRRMEAWLREHDGDFPEGFAASPLSRHLGFAWSQATASAALNILHDEGLLRLDRRGLGGGKFYKLVAG